MSCERYDGGILLRFSEQYSSDYIRIIGWCIEEFEIDTDRWRYYDKCSHELAIFFRDESDAIACKLRWT